MVELARALEAVINDQLVRRLVLWNFGTSAPMPRWTINTKDPDELIVRIKLDQILQGMGLEFTENYARSTYSVPKPAEADQVLQPRPQQNPQNIGGVGVASPVDVPQPSTGEFADTRGKERARIELRRRLAFEGEQAVLSVTASGADEQIGIWQQRAAKLGQIEEEERKTGIKLPMQRLARHLRQAP
jgi:phage gp29-like protein